MLVDAASSREKSPCSCAYAEILILKQCREGGGVAGLSPNAWALFVTLDSISDTGSKLGTRHPLPCWP